MILLLESCVIINCRNVERVNSLKTRLETKDVFKENWERNLHEKYSSKSLGRRDSLKQLKVE